MSFDITIFALLHVLVFVYWLGGDLGAFYTSRFLTEPGVSPERRLLAAKIVGDVDMAPRTALILALPTGLVLALSKSWIDGPLWWGWLALGIGLVWLTIAWKLHFAHGSNSLINRVDLAIRWVLALALLGAGVASLQGALILPVFISLKLILLAAAILMGLYIRITLKPLGPALAGLSGTNAAGAEASLAHTLNRARPLVIAIWVFLLSAALLGLWTPSTL